MEPGLVILIQPIKGSAGILYSYMAQRPINVPVLPNPALQCIAIAPESGFEKCPLVISKNLSTIWSGGVDPSMKNRSLCSISFSMKYFLSYFYSFSLITRLTPNFLNISTYFFGWWPYLWLASRFSIGPMKAMNLPGMIQLTSPFSTRS